MTGELFGPYRIDELIGQGGYGAVHRAYDTRHDRMVAVKRLSGVHTDDHAKERFLREAQLMARLNEPHIIPVHQYGEIDGQLYLVMPLVGGTDLAGVLAAGGALEPTRAIAIIGQVAGALDAAHRAGLVHRDVKPSNVLLRPPSTPGGEEFAYLIDFGIAASTHEPRLTAAGSVVGSSAYMAPERFAGSGDSDHRVDVYALGCLLFEALTGHPPFVGSNLLSLMRLHLDAPPPRIGALARGSAEAMNAVIARALAKDPNRRYQSAGELAAAARAAVERGSGPHGRFPPVHGTPGPVRVEPPLGGWGDPRRGGSYAHPIANYPTSAPPYPPPPPPPTAVAPAPTRRRRTGALLAGLLVAVPVLVLVVLFALGVLPPSGATGTPDAVDGSPTVSPGGSSTPVAPALPATITVGRGAWDVALTPDGRRAYVTNSGTDADPGNSVSVIDTAAGAVVATITVGVAPTDVEIAPDGRFAYVANYGSTASPDNTVSVIDTARDVVVSSITVGTSPQAVAVSPDGSRLYSADRTSDTVSVIDTAARTVTKTITVGDGPIDVAVTPDGRRVYVADFGTNANSVTVIDTATDEVSATVPVGTSPNVVTVSPDGRFVYATNFGSNNISVIDAARDVVVSTIPVGGSPYDVVLSPDGRRGYVTVNGGDAAPSSKVFLLDPATNAITGSVEAGRGAWGLASAPDGSRLYVTNNGTTDAPGDTVSVLPTG